jgi:F-type H+-transporting ATPase subunit epsilon
LSDTAERAESLDESEAIKAKEIAEKKLSNKDTSIDYAKASAQLAEAVARLKTIQKLRKKQ